MSLAAAFPGRLARVTASPLFWSVVDQGLFALSNFALTFALSLALPTAAFGVFVLLYSVYLLFVPFHSALLTEPMLVHDRLSLAGRGAYLGSLALMHGLFSLLASALILVLLAALHLGGAGPGEAALLCGANAGLLGLGLLRRVCSSVSRPAVAAAAGGLYLVLCAVTLLAAHGWNLLNVTTALAALLVNSLLAGAFVVYALGVRVEAAPRDMFAGHLHTHLAYGRWSALSAAFLWLPANAVFAVFAGAGDSVGAAGTRVALNLIMPLQQALFGVSAALVPMLARLPNAARRDRTLGRVLRVFGGGAAAYGLLVAVCGPLILDLVYGDRYRLPAWSLVVLGLSPLCSVVYQVLIAAVRAANVPRAIFLNSVGAGVASALLAVPLVLTLGTAGALVAFTLSAAYSAVMAARLHARIRKGLP